MVATKVILEAMVTAMVPIMVRILVAEVTIMVIIMVVIIGLGIMAVKILKDYPANYVMIPTIGIYLSVTKSNRY